MKPENKQILDKIVILNGIGATQEKANKSDFDLYSAEFTTLQNKVNNLQTNDLEARNEIIDLKLKLEQQTAINLLNKTGVGFYDTFKNSDNIDTVNTTAVYDAVNKNVNFPYANYQVKATADCSNVKILNVDSPVTIGDKIDNLNTILNSVIKDDGVTYDRTGITSVVNSAFVTSATARPQVLSNGWIVTCIYDTTNTVLKFYVSKDGGVTFTLLTTSVGTGYDGGFSMCSYGLYIYVFATKLLENTAFFLSFDVTSVGASLVTKSNIDSSQTSFGTGCSIAVSSTGVLTAAWCSTNNTYSHSFNIRSAKSVDGGVTWTKQDGTSGVDQVTSNTSVGADSINVYTLYDKNNSPVILYQFVSASVYYVMSITWNNPTWTPHNVWSVSSYAQSNPVATLQKYGTNAGRIWVTWIGMDSTDTTANNIRVSYSDDNGVTWSAMQKLTSGNTYNQRMSSITTDINGNIYIIWIGNTITNSVQNVRQIMWNGINWSSITEITAQNTNNMSFPSTCDNYYNFTSPITIWQDNQNTRVAFYGKWTVGATTYDITLENTITVTSGQELNMYPSPKVLKMKDETFDTFNNLNLNIYPDKINKATIKGAVNNSTSVVTGATDKELTTGDKLFMNGVLNEVLSCTNNIITNTVTDATVVNSVYDMSGNGGRKLVRLSNGLLVAISNVNIGLFLSSDNGKSWLQLNRGGTSWYSASICSRNQDIFILFQDSNGNPHLLKGRVFSASDFVATNFTENIVDPSYIATASGNCSLAINSQGTELHACWSCKNSNYPNSFNIRYAKGVINSDGSVTWGSVEQLTTYNNTSYGYINASIIIYNNIPTIIIEATGGAYCSDTNSNLAGWGIFVIKKDNSLIANINNINVSWTRATIYAINNTSYKQSSPCAIFVPQSINGLTNGRIWVAWHGFNATNSTYYSLYLASSDDGGATWSNQILIQGTSTNMPVYPTITANKNNKIDILFYDNRATTYSNIWKISNENNAWGTSTKVTNLTSGNGFYPNCLFDSTFTLDFSSPLFIYQDNQNSKVGFYGTWTVEEGYNLTMQNPVTLNDGDKVPIVDLEAQQNNAALNLENVDEEKFIYGINNLNTTNTSIKITGKNNKINSLVYAIA